jgi:hypothetical protein
MSKLTRLQASLAKIDARILEVEVAYPLIVKVKSYSKGFGEVSTTYQEFGAVAGEYRRLLAAKDQLEDQIAELSESESGGSAVAEFQEVQ